MTTYKTWHLNWQGQNIDIRFHKNIFPSAYKSLGYVLVHLEIETIDRSPLPITETGYRSHFCSLRGIEAHGTPVDFVRAWLDNEAQSQQWKAFEEKSRQLNLFE